MTELMIKDLHINGELICIASCLGRHVDSRSEYFEYFKEDQIVSISGITNHYIILNDRWVMPIPQCLKCFDYYRRVMSVAKG